MEKPPFTLGREPEPQIGLRHALAAFVITLLVAWAMSAICGCGSVQEQSIRATGGAAAAGSGGAAGSASATGGSIPAGGAAGGGGAGAGGAVTGGTGGTGGAGGGGGAAAPCGSGPVYPGGECSRGTDCLSGTCSGGFCTTCATPNCDSEKVAAPMPCIDSGWVPASAAPCDTDPVCWRGYRCVTCGAFPAGAVPCIYDRARTSICVRSCSDCAVP